MAENSENFAEALDLHLSTWGPNCGAPLAVYRGHLFKLLTSHAELCARSVEATDAERSRHARNLLDKAAAKVLEVSKDSLA